MNLKFAGWSILVHIGLLSIRPSVDILPQVETPHVIEVSYLPKQVGKIPPPPPKAKLVIEATPSAPVAPAALQPPRLTIPSPPPPPPVPEPVRSPEPVVQAVVIPPEPSSMSSSLPEDSWVALQHKELVREYLRKNLKYPLLPREGTVRFQIFLGKEGGLRHLQLMAASDAVLAAQTLADIQRAGPFPSFPEGLDQSQVRYEFLVRYQAKEE